MNYFLPRDYKSKNIHDAGSKARMDIEHILEKAGFTPIAKPYSISTSRILHFFRTLAIVLQFAKRIRKGDIIVLQYPTKYYSFICHIAHWHGAKVISFIHDLGCFRKKHNSEKKEMRLMNQSDALIGCNQSTCNWLLDHGFVGHEGKKIIESLQAFDFLSDAKGQDRKATWPLRQIAYAGQLTWRKNRFLYHVGSCINQYQMNIYGKGFCKTQANHPEKFSIKGFMLPDDLIQQAEGDFGLVWDGDSLDCCSGDWGEYLIINTPHKVSLYLRCGLPIIIWNKAAMAPFIKNNGIGICVNSLDEISQIYDRISPEEYYQMCNQVKRVSKQMAEGWYFKTAVTKVINQLL